MSESLISRFPEGRSLEADLGRWWVLHTKPNCEAGMANYFMRRNISYYLPLIIKSARVGGLKRIRTTIAPLFRGYLCFALDKKEHSLLYDTKKFVGIIQVEDQERFVRELTGISKAIMTEEDLWVVNGIVPGKRVYIGSGPFEGHEGVVVRRSKKQRLALSVHMFNQSVLVNLDRGAIIEPL
jgi:transcription antitermination factor NusG